MKNRYQKDQQPKYSVKPLLYLQLFSDPNHLTPPLCPNHPTPLPPQHTHNSRLFFIRRNRDEKYESQCLHVPIKEHGHGQGLFMLCPGLLKTTLLGNKIKKKIKEKIWKILGNTSNVHQILGNVNLRKYKVKFLYNHLCALPIRHRNEQKTQPLPS